MAGVRSLFVAACLIPLGAGAQNEPARFRQSAVVSDSKLASDVGAAVMVKGGNAVDAAIATAFALAVTHPAAGNLGGGGFMLVRMADGRTISIDYRERAPAAASKNMYLDAAGKVLPEASTVGYKAAGVPGTVAGMAEAHRRFGKLPWRDLVEPAVKLARNGFPLSWDLAQELRQMNRLFQRFPESYRIFNRSGRYYEWGETFRQPELASTLERIRDQGEKGFYAGETAKRLAADMAENGGLITAKDLADYRVSVREPLRGAYREYEILTMPPPSSGGIALLQMLGILEGFDLKRLGFASSATYHRMIEAMKRAFADRAVHLGDPDFVKVPTAQLLEKTYVSRLRASIDPEKATPAGEVKAGAIGTHEGDHTTHYSVVDGDGNAVANTYTINSGYGSGAVAMGLGFLLNNEMDDFAAKSGVPNVYGLIQGEANSIEPGKRPLSSMTPTMLVKDGRLFMVVGSPGGPTIINTVLQTILDVVDFGMNVQRAVGAPRIHHQWLPDEVRFEPMGFSTDTKAALEKMGHKFAARAGSMGSCHAILVEPGTRHRLTGVDPRSADAGASGR